MKREEAQELIERGVKELNEALSAGKSERLQKFLEVMSRFPNYSFNNCMLVAMQFPDATLVQGFVAWKKVGRTVKKGSKGIGIIAPMSYKAKYKEAPGDVNKNVVRGFKVVHVFDVSQTEGDELPEFAIATGDPGDNVTAIESLIRSHEIQLDYEEISGGADGVSRPGQIVVRPDLPPARTLMVLIHEYAHSCLHQTERRKETTKTIRETEAEAVAHIVGQALGLQSLEQSVDYIQLYNGDEKVLTDSMDHIQKTAAHILESAFSFAKQTEVMA